MSEYWFRNADGRYPFFRSDSTQPPARWHGEGEGPTQYLADTPDGAWAEFLRHEAITDPADLRGVARNLWAVELEPGGETVHISSLPPATQQGGLSSYLACQADARVHRAAGATALQAHSAALLDTSAGGQRVTRGGLIDVAGRDGTTLALFGERDRLPGWICCDRGRPASRLVARVRPL